jgi:acetyl/propionyl-CoA carboxylase alpha subunit/acetyl-CoA carboxylase carboxyltransferase component
MPTKLGRIAIVNRAEAAMRLINAVRELDLGASPRPRTIALHTAAEHEAMFVREADEACCLDNGGPARPGMLNPYLDLDVLGDALRRCEADAAWVGWGFVAERPEFAELCQQLGIVFIGPGPDVMRRLGDKIGSKRLAEEAGVPVAPWSGGPVASLEEARMHAASIGYPLMVKASGGGGGRGIRFVGSDDELPEALRSAREEAAGAFGDPTLFMEQVVTGARHVEVQIIGDHQGTVWALGVRDCSVQRRHQKVLEESHCVVLSADQHDELAAAAVRLARHAGYVNAGTVEFLYQPANQTFAFMEVNTRLQVEHPVTELCSGADLVKLQLHVAAGGRLGPEVPRSTGHAIEARLNAEDPARGFMPAPGTIEFLQWPTGPGIRVDTGVGVGGQIPAEYDSMIAKIIAWGRDRDEALGRLHRALNDTTVLVRGGTTNKSFLSALVRHPDVQAGRVDTTWLDRLVAQGRHVSKDLTEVAFIAAAIDVYEAAAAQERTAFLASAARGRPQLGPDLSRTVELRGGGWTRRAEVARVGPGGRFRVGVDGRTLDVQVERQGAHHSRMRAGGRHFRVVAFADGIDHLVEVDGSGHRFSSDDAGTVRAPAAAVVVAVLVSPGDVVAAGERVAVLEAMKMEVAITAPVGGRVSDVLVGPNLQVSAGSALVRIDVSEADADESPGPAATADDGFDVDSLVTPTETDQLAIAAGLLDELCAYVLGFDIDDEAAVATLDAYEQHRHRLASSAETAAVLGAAELAVLDAFADVAALSRDRRDGEELAADELHSSREHLNTYLRSLDLEAEGLPDRFRTKLLRALSHYGVADLHRTTNLEEALLRVVRAKQRAAQAAVVMAGLLDDMSPAAPDDRLRDVLDRLVSATQRRFPALANRARNVRYRLFDLPLITRTRDQVMAAMRDHLSTLASRPDAGDRFTRIEQLVACPQPMVGLLAGAGRGADVLAEVLTRRYYKIRPLVDLHGERYDDATVLRAQYRHHERLVHVLAVHAAARDGVAAAARAASRAAADFRPSETAVVDLYVAWGSERSGAPARGHERAVGPAANGRTGPSGDDEIEAASLAAIEAADFPAPVRRVAVMAVRSPAEVTVLTYRRDPLDLDAGPFTEDRPFRGLHPMIARRLNLWRMTNFDYQRLDSAGDAHLFHAVARSNASDERLIAVAEVRDLTPVLDLGGGTIALPELEQVLAACCDSIRRNNPGQRLGWNRIQLFVWPALDIPLDELLPLAHRLAPLTEGLGLEQVVIQGRFRPTAGAPLTEAVLRLGYEPGRGVTMRLTELPTEPLQPLDDLTQKVLAARRRGYAHPSELIGMLAGPGRFVEYDFQDDGTFGPTDRPTGANTAGVVVGVVVTPTAVHPEGMTRVAILSDPTKALGSLAEPECRRVLAALELAEHLAVPLEWVAVSAGARIAMHSGSENLDWVGRVLRRIVEFTQQGGEVNVIVAGINVGAQPYWNAEATMLQHTKGILVMTPDSAMVLTGKQALDYSGGVSAEDNLGLGGFERIMGPNGEAQYFAPDLSAAVQLLFSHYTVAYVAPGERFPRQAPTTDPRDRDVRHEPHRIDGVEFEQVGDIFSDKVNPDRKKPFDMRVVMRAVIDKDLPALERWAAMQDAETAIVFDAHLGGHPVSLLGVESRPLPRYGAVPADGPAQWTAGTLFPLSSKKVARAINAASGNRPVVILANLSGFDGAPESLRKLQLEYGAEIGRAIVNFDGPIVLCVVSRYHGGAFVVFSATLNDSMEVLAVEGSYASVIGGAPAAAVVFTGEVHARTRRDPRVVELETAIAAAAEPERVELRVRLAEVQAHVHAEKLGEVAAEFDAIHSVERAQQVGSVHRIIPAAGLRPALIEAVERGIHRSTAELEAGAVQEPSATD